MKEKNGLYQHNRSEADIHVALPPDVPEACFHSPQNPCKTQRVFVCSGDDQVRMYPRNHFTQMFPTSVVWPVTA